MRPRPEDIPGLAFVGVTGVIWGSGLARLLAEAGLQSFLYTSVLGVALVALGCAVVFALLWRLWRPQADFAWALPLALPALYTFGGVAGPLAGGGLLVGAAAVTALGAVLSAREEPPRGLLPVVLGLATLGLYMRTLLPSVGVADTLEFQVVAARLGVAHPTGYPLYILLSNLFTWLPVKTVAWRVNLGSAVFGMAAVVVLYGIVRRLTDRPLLSLLSALAFAFSRTFWSQAVIAEVYTLHNLLVAAILLLLVRKIHRDDYTGTGSAQRWRAVLFLTGLSLTNHLTTVLLIPAVGVALLWDRPRLRTRDWLVAGGLFLLGLSVYLFIPLRWPALHDGRSMALRDFAIYVTGGQFHGALDLAGWRDPTRWHIVGRLLQEPFGWIGLGLAGLGLARLTIRDRRALALTGVTFVAYVVYGLDYTVPDIAVFLIPAHLVVAIWMGSGVALLADVLSSVLSLARRPGWDIVWRPGLAALFALIPLSRLWVNAPEVDRSRDGGGYAWGRYVLRQALMTESAILADTNKFAPLYYLQQVEGVRPDLDIVLLGNEALYQAELRRRLAAGQTVYLARYLPHLQAFYLHSSGPLVAVDDEPPGEVPGQHPASDVVANFGAGIQLLGADVDEDALGRPMYHVTLHWQAARAVEEDVVVRLRLVDGQGEVRWSGEGQRPVSGLYPTNAWRAAVPISDTHELAIPPWLPPGPYQLEVGLFAPFDEAGLPVDGGPTAWQPLETVSVEPPSDPDPLPHARLYSFSDGSWLTGFDLPGEVTAGAPLLVDLAWRNVGRGDRVQVRWAAGPNTGLAAGGRTADEVGHALVDGMVRSRHRIVAPSDAGRFELRVGLVEQDVRCSWLGPPADGCALTEVTVVPGGEGLANFGEKVLLLRANVTQSEARPGDVIQVFLQWRGLRAMQDDYTVFVHLVGPDGRLHGQADSWPVQGTYPTSQWSPGREVTDPYEVRLASDAPLGPYRVEVGWYELDTMQRLQSVDEAGEAIADTFVVGTFDVEE